MIEIRGLAHSFLQKNLFSGVNLRLWPHDRYGVTGANGCGKSTLLRMIAGEMEADDGEIAIDALARVFRIGQDFALDDEKSIVATAMMGQSEVYAALVRLDELLRIEHKTPESLHLIAKLEEQISRGEGYRLRANAQAILSGLGIKNDEHDKPLSTLSGGYKWRVFLAQALVKNPDVLMLDEPTNHLDIVSIRWLEQFLSSYQGLVMVVSHDRRFLNNVCTKILDIDFGTITEYSGNFEAFMNARSLFLLQKEKEILAQEKEIAKKQAFIDRFRAKATKARQAQSRIKQLERMEIVEPVKSSRIHPHFRFELSEPGSKEVLEVKALNKNYGDKTILKDFTFAVRRKEKVAIIGANGTGKSTLIKALSGEFSECNRFIKWGHGVSLGYFAQDTGSHIKASKISVLEWLWQFCADKPQSYVQGLLGRMLFSGQDAQKLTKDLSGGELARLNFAYLMLLKPNVLLLDEPTNHLDLEAIESLSSALDEYEGTLIAVSHDRSFIDSIFQRIIEITPNGAEDFLGSYSEFSAHKERDFLDAKQELSFSKKATSKEPETRSSYEEQKQRRAHVQKLKKKLEKLMLSVEELEQRMTKIDEQFLDPAFYIENGPDRVNALKNEKTDLEAQLEQLLGEWEQCEKELGEME